MLRKPIIFYLTAIFLICNGQTMADGWEFSEKFMYDFNTTQDNYTTVYGFKVDCDPGQEFRVDYSAFYAKNKSE